MLVTKLKVKNSIFVEKNMMSCSTDGGSCYVDDISIFFVTNELYLLYKLGNAQRINN